MFLVQFFNIKTSMGSSWHDGVSAEESYNDFGRFRVSFIPVRRTKNFNIYNFSLEIDEINFFAAAVKVLKPDTIDAMNVICEV